MRAVFGLFAFVMFATFVVIAVAETGQSNVPQNAQIDYPGFVRLTSELESVRAKHRVPVHLFQKMAKDKNTTGVKTTMPLAIR